MSSHLQISVLLLAVLLCTDAVNLDRVNSKKRSLSEETIATISSNENLAKTARSPANLQNRKGSDGKFFGKTIELPGTPSDSETVSGVTTDSSDDVMEHESEVMSAAMESVVPTNAVHETLVTETVAVEPMVSEGAGEEVLGLQNAVDATMVPENDSEENMVPESDAEQALLLQNAVDATMVPENDSEENMVPESDSKATMELENDVGASVVPETAVAVVDPKSQHAELLEMNETLLWEMATRSQDDQVIDRKDELSWFPALIFQKLENFVQNAPTAVIGQNAEAIAHLTKMVESWKQEKVQPIDLDQQTVQIFQIQNSLNQLDDELTNENMSGIKATPAVLDIVYDVMENDAHDHEKAEFQWKVCLRKPTRYVKSVGLFFSGISIAMAYLGQVVKVGRWAMEKNFLASQQMTNLANVVEENLAKLNSIQHEVASKMGLNVDKIGISDLFAQQVKSINNLFITDLEGKLAKIKEIAELEEVQFNDAQIGTLLVLIALNIANNEVEKLEAPFVGTQLTWPLFVAAGEVSKAAQVLNQMQI